MHVQLQCRTSTVLQRLVPAFPMIITAWEPGHSIRQRGYRRYFPTGQPVCMPAFEPFDLELSGHFSGGAGCSVELDEDALSPIEVAGFSAPPPSLPVLLSRMIFRAPERPWNARLIAETLDMRVDRLRQQLFARGAALSQICKTQRLMRAVFESVQTDLPVARIARRIGWAEGGDLEATFHDWFGISLQTVGRLRQYPARR